MSIRRAVTGSLVGIALAACEPTLKPQPAATDPAATGTQSEAQRTLEMERRAAEATRKLQEAQQQGLSEAQAEDAYKQFEAERARLAAEGQATSEPPPPQ